MKLMYEKINTIKADSEKEAIRELMNRDEVSIEKHFKNDSYREVTDPESIPLSQINAYFLGLSNQEPRELGFGRIFFREQRFARVYDPDFDAEVWDLEKLESFKSEERIYRTEKVSENLFKVTTQITLIVKQSS